MTIRRIAVAAAIGLVVLLAPGNASAKSYTLPEARVEVVINRDGSLQVTEHLTYSFSGSFSGGYREIPLRRGEKISHITVSEGSLSYSPGAPTALGSSGAPNTYGTTFIPEGMRVVWHYNAFNEEKTFTLNYRLHNFIALYDDVADFNMKVWGDEWTVDLDRLDAKVVIPGGADDLRVWGHVRVPPLTGGVEPDPDGRGATLRANNVAAGNWVEMRMVFPSSLLAGATDVRHLEGAGLGQILREERAFAEQYGAQLAELERDRERLDQVTRNIGWLVIAGLVVAFVPAALLAYWIYRRHGREPVVPAVPQHITEPPGPEPPALVAALLDSSGERATGEAFAATMFDLVRRDHIDAIPTVSTKKSWFGLRSRDISDLVLKPKREKLWALKPFEREVFDAVVHASKDHEHFHLTEFRSEIKSEPAHYSTVFEDFTKKVTDAVDKAGWWKAGGLKPAAVACGIFWAVAAIAVALIFIAPDRSAGLPWRSFILAALAIAAGVNGLVLAGFLLQRRGWERRSEKGAVAASDWAAFRRFLSDFAGMREAVPGSIEIWEQYLCYGIAFGIADRVLAAAQIHAPTQVDGASPIFFIDGSGAPGSGFTAFSVSEISSAIRDATPPSSGGGGGFSGGGGGGGGGGGAW